MNNSKENDMKLNELAEMQKEYSEHPGTLGTNFLLRIENIVVKEPGLAEKFENISKENIVKVLENYQDFPYLFLGGDVMDAYLLHLLDFIGNADPQIINGLRESYLNMDKDFETLENWCSKVVRLFNLLSSKEISIEEFNSALKIQGLLFSNRFLSIDDNKSFDVGLVKKAADCSNKTKLNELIKELNPNVFEFLFPKKDDKRSTFIKFLYSDVKDQEFFINHLFNVHKIKNEEKAMKLYIMNLRKENSPNIPEEIKILFNGWSS